MNKKRRFFTVILALVMTLSMLSVTAFATAEPDEEEDIPEVEETIPEETMAPSEPPEDTGTKTTQLLYCKETNKQFIEIQDRDGNIFYIVIDYDDPVKDKEEQYRTYFLNAVDANDLEALAEDTQGKPEVCICRDKCQPGKINMRCPVCASNMSECMGKEPDPPKETTPSDTTNDNNKGPNPVALLIVFAIVGGGGVYAFMKFKKEKETPAPQNSDDLDYDEDEDEDAPWETEGEDSEDSLE